MTTLEAYRHDVPQTALAVALTLGGFYLKKLSEKSIIENDKDKSDISNSFLEQWVKDSYSR